MRGGSFARGTRRSSSWAGTFRRMRKGGPGPRPFESQATSICFEWELEGEALGGDPGLRLPPPIRSGRFSNGKVARNSAGVAEAAYAVGLGPPSPSVGEGGGLTGGSADGVASGRRLDRTDSALVEGEPPFIATFRRALSRSWRRLRRRRSSRSLSRTDSLHFLVALRLQRNAVSQDASGGERVSPAYSVTACLPSLPVLI